MTRGADLPGAATQKSWHTPPGIPLPGAKIARYTILELLGEGGMGAVYSAHDPVLERHVAIKLLHARRSDRCQHEGRARLLREARAMARLSHPNVVAVHDVGSDGELDYVAMELVDGITLADWLGKPRSTGEVLRVFVDAGRGLAHAHASGLIHRDFKPHNVLVDATGRARVTDFGLVRHIDDASATPPTGGSYVTPTGGSCVTPADIATSDTVVGDSSLTADGVVMGTPLYMSPEQHDGKRADARSDQFSFCVSLYQAFTGQLPFRGKNPWQLRYSIAAGPPPPIKAAAISPGIARAIQRGLSEDPASRFPSMTALLAELSPPRRLPRAWLVGAAVVAVSLIGVTGVALTGTAGQSIDACDVEAGRISQVWNPEIRQRLRERFGAGSREFFDRFAAGVDAYAARWEQRSRAMCRAAETSPPAAEDKLLQRTCMLAGERGVATLVGVLSRADARGRERAIEIANQLPRVDDCADVAALRAGIAPPSDPAARARVEAVRWELQEVRTLRSAELFSEAAQRAERAVDSARKLHYLPLVAEAWLELGRLRADKGEPAPARQALREAELSAEECGHRAVRAWALVEQIRVELELSSQRDGIAELGRRAAMAIKQAGDDPALTARLDRLLAGVDADESGGEAALARLDTALAAIIDLRGEDDVEVASTLDEIGAVLLELARPGEALVRYQRALAVRQRIFPVGHPRIVQSIEGVARALHNLERYQEADLLNACLVGFWASERGRHTFRELYGPPPPESWLTIRGWVVDAAGAPVAGASVIAGNHLEGDGERFGHLDGHTEVRHAIRRTTTGPAGEFAIQVPAHGGAIVAEHADRGRTPFVEVDDPSAALTLAVAPFGRVDGRVANAGGGWVYASAVGTTAQRGVRVALRGDGTFSFPRLPAGRQALRVVEHSGQGRAAHAIGAVVEVSAGRTMHLDMSIPGGVELELDVREALGRSPAGLVVLSQTTLRATRLGDLLRTNPADVQVANVPPAPPVFRGIAPGQYSVCVVPLPGDPRDPAVGRKLMADGGASLPCRCQPLNVAAGRAPRQRIALAAP